MKKKLKADSGKKRGRPSVSKPKGEMVRKNGLLQRQWNRIQSESAPGRATELLRQIVDWYFLQKDAEAQISVANVALASAEEADAE